MARQSVRTFVRRTFFSGRLAAILVLVAVVGLTYFQAERNAEALSFSAAGRSRDITADGLLRAASFKGLTKGTGRS